jgi:hypothetical protein
MSSSINGGFSSSNSLGWVWSQRNISNPVSSSGSPTSRIHFSNINRLVILFIYILFLSQERLQLVHANIWDWVHPVTEKMTILSLTRKTGAMAAYLNQVENSMLWKSIGASGTGLGPAANVRFADIDSDKVSVVRKILSFGLNLTYSTVLWLHVPTCKW